MLKNENRMSFFKLAENLLNNLDQQTQSSISTALHKKDERKNKKKTNLSVSETNPSNPINSQSVSNFGSEFYQNSSTRTSTTSLKNLFNKPNKEDELINFLNNNDAKNLPLSKGSSRTDLEKPEPEIVEEKVNFIIGSKSNETEDEMDKTAPEQSQETKFLKKEIDSLNQEINALMKRIKDKDDDYLKVKKKIENYQNQVSQSDKIIRELRSREEDLNESIKSKDSQLAVFRVRLDEYDNELKNRKEDIDSLRSESERILKDHSTSSDLQSQVVETLKEKINALENELNREKEAYASAQKEYMTLQSRLETEKESLINNLRSIEQKISEEKMFN
ncbi:golgin subfamily A member 5 [Brachionus plicatilis]|uniref:Golgin subfamily A member 5 n=1 Tax=Brachionus plicatilis TaxID=10195 RepID=A0A3M7SC90_BRAPC|nr:golgin subfamily A member 5 [Brachionus plicatilis]